MKIKPNDNFRLLGTDIELDKNKIYEAEDASNIRHTPASMSRRADYKNLGLIFVNGLLLNKYEYKIISE